MFTDEHDLSQDQVADLTRLAKGMRVVVSRDADRVDPRDVEILAGWFDAPILLSLPNLRWGQHWAAGVDRLTSDAAVKAKDFLLTNGSGIHGVQMTEHIFGLLLSLARDLHNASRRQLAHQWLTPAFSTGSPVWELAGKTMLLVGVGAIGSRTATLAEAFGMRVIGVRRDPTQWAPGVDDMVGSDQLLAVLPKADVVVLTVPLTPATHGMIGEAELRAMKPNAVLINVGRGGTVRKEVLVRALREGWIGGAGLDVVDPEPLPQDSPLWDMDNVIITSHYAGHTPEYTGRAMTLFLDNLLRFQEGRPLLSRVSMDLGY